MPKRPKAELQAVSNLESSKMSTAEKLLTSQEIVSRLDELPTLPVVVYELARVINDPMSSTSDVEKIMGNDSSLTVKVLKLANSAYYSIPGGVKSLQRAIAYIGYDTISQLALSASIINALDSKNGADPLIAKYFDVREFWKHSLAVGMASEVIAKVLKYKTPSDLFTCGLVHDMGKMALLTTAKKQFLKSLEYARSNDLTMMEAEIELDTLRHTEIGFQLSTKWRLPYQMQIAIANHHQRDPQMRGGLSRESNMVVDIVFLANLLIHALEFGNSGHGKVLGLPRDVLERLGVNQDILKEIVLTVKEKIKNADSFLKIIDGV